MAEQDPLKHWPPRAKLTVALLTIVFLVVVAIGAARVDDVSGDGQSLVTPTSTSSSSSTVPTTTTEANVGSEEGGAPSSNPTVVAPGANRELLAQLTVVDASTNPPGYSRDLFPSWLDLEGNGCDARQDTLIAESLVTAEVVGEDCDVASGRWLSIYDGVEVSDPSELDVDHLVPLAEAWRSGAAAWETSRRTAFANDLDYPDHLIAVTASTNRSKSDSPPNEWRPPRHEAWCRYATAWITVKVRWSLTATTAERDALGQMLESC